MRQLAYCEFEMVTGGASTVTVDPNEVCEKAADKAVEECKSNMPCRLGVDEEELHDRVKEECIRILTDSQK